MRDSGDRLCLATVSNLDDLRSTWTRAPELLRDRRVMKTTERWSPEDGGYWVASCVLCSVRSSGLRATEHCDLWAILHFEMQHSDRMQDATHMHSRRFFLGVRPRG